MKKNIAITAVLLVFFTANSILSADDNAQPFTFSRAAELAILASAELRYSRASQEIMEGTWKWGLRAYFPQISLTVSENDRLQKLGADSFIKNYGISLEQLVWDGGRTAISRSLQRTELDLSSARLDRMADEIAESAISAYRNILSAREILEIRKASLALYEEQRRILWEEVQLGLALPVDLASADVSLLEIRLDILSLQLDLDEMERQFAELLGLDKLPELTEKVDIEKPTFLPSAALASSLARENNPDLAEARYAITKRQAEARYASTSWIPTVRLVGNVSVSGQSYPLTRFNWSVGISIEFSGPWFQNRFGAQYGQELPYDSTAIIQNSFTPIPNPASHYGKAQAELALSLEREMYSLMLERTGRMAAAAVEKIRLADQKRALAIQAAEITSERCRIEEIRLGLGQITRLKLMETLMELTQREIAVVEAATALLEAERELERFLDLKPGELAELAEFGFWEKL